MTPTIKSLLLAQATALHALIAEPENQTKISLALSVLEVSLEDAEGEVDEEVGREIRKALDAYCGIGRVQ